MPDSDKDHLARALEGLSAGQHAEHDDAHHAEASPSPNLDVTQPTLPADTGSSEPPAAKLRPAAPVPMADAPRPVAPRPVVPPGATPLPPGLKPVPKPVTGPRVPVPPKRTPTPVARPAIPDRPAAPQVPVPSIPTESIQEAVPVEDDDAVIVPAPAPEMLAQLRHRPPARHPHLPNLRTVSVRSIAARQTIVPVLLVAGVMSLLAGTLRLLVSEDTPLSTLPKWLAWAAYAIGALLLLVAVLNMLQLRSELSRRS